MLAAVIACCLAGLMVLVQVVQDPEQDSTSASSEQQQDGDDPGDDQGDDPGADEDPPSDGRFNAITIVVDDMNDFSCKDAPQYLPKSSKWLVDQGRCYEDTTATSPACCPARTVINTGQLPHNNGVLRQVDAHLFNGRDSLQRDLTDAGVNTFGVGKFLNGLPADALPSGQVDSGFAEYSFWRHYDYLHFKVHTEDGQLAELDPLVHSTVYTGEVARQFLSEQADAEDPFYLYTAFLSPHDQTGTGKASPPVPTEQNADKPVPPFRFKTEKDTSDKLKLFKRLGRSEGYFRAKQAARVRSLYDVDDQMALMFEQLEDDGLLDSTALFFVSDNGYALGQNKWEGKATPYPASVDVPMLAYLPPALAEREGVSAAKVEPGTDRRPVDLVDIAPTIYDVMGVEPDHVIDGHSMLGDYERTRGRFLEFTNERSRFVLMESGRAPFWVPTWAMVRDGDRALIEYYLQNGKLLRREYYEDPGMERNLLSPKVDGLTPRVRDRIDKYEGQLRLMRNCKGTVEQESSNPCP